MTEAKEILKKEDDEETPIKIVETKNIKAKLVLCKMIIPSLFLICINVFYDYCVLYLSYTFLKKEFSFLLQIVILMMGISVIFSFPTIIIPCLTNKLFVCYRYVNFVFIWNVFGLIVVMTGAVITVYETFGCEWMILSAFYLLFGLLCFVVSILWIYFSVLFPLKLQVESVNEIIVFEKYYKHHSVDYF